MWQSHQIAFSQELLIGFKKPKGVFNQKNYFRKHILVYRSCRAVTLLMH